MSSFTIQYMTRADDPALINGTLHYQTSAPNVGDGVMFVTLQGDILYEVIRRMYVHAPGHTTVKVWLSRVPV